MNRRTGVLAAFLTCIVLTGCANTGRLRTFSDFSYPQDESTTIYLLVDCLVLDDVEGKHHALDVEYNKQVCGNFARAMASLIQDDSKFPVTVKAVTLGLLAGSGKFVETTDEATGKVNLPIYVTDARLSPEEQRVFTSMSERLNDSIYGWKERQKYVDSLKGTKYPLLRQARIGEDSLIMMAFLDGVRHGGSMPMGQGNLSALFTLGSAANNRRSMTSAKAVLLKGDGTPVWADAMFTHDAIDSDSQIGSLTQTLLRYFPFRVVGAGDVPRGPASSAGAE